MASSPLRRAGAALVLALVAPIAVAAIAAGAKSVNAHAVPRPPIIWRPIPFTAQRRAEMAAYAERHYGIDRWRLQQPHVIVEHYTGNGSFSATWNTFAADAPDPELHELPGDCAHFVVDTDGTIYQLVRLDTMCRHTVGLNYTAIGIEHVGESDPQILGNARQLHASLALTLWLMERFRITFSNVIGHNESLSSPYHRERYAAWRCQTHADWNRHDMTIYRDDLRQLAKRYDIVLGPQPELRKTRCRASAVPDRGTRTKPIIGLLITRHRPHHLGELADDPAQPIPERCSIGRTRGAARTRTSTRPLVRMMIPGWH